MFGIWVGRTRLSVTQTDNDIDGLGGSNGAVVFVCGIFF